MITEFLKQLGLNDKQSTVYLTVLEQGKSTPQQISRITKINRTTVYSVGKELVDKQLIVEDLTGPRTYLVAKSPAELNGIVEQEQRALNKKKDLITQLVKQLEPIAKNANYSVPKIIFIEERNLEDYLYKKVADWSASLAKYDNTWWGFQDKSLVRNYETWIDWVWDKGLPKQIAEQQYVKLLSNQAAEAIKKKKYQRRIIKFWDKGDFTATVWILGDYVIMLNTSEHPYNLVEINDRLLAHNLRELFKGIWEKN